MKRFFKTLLTILLCAALIAAGMLYGPRLYRLLFGNSNATWVSERFSEELNEKRELIVLEKVIAGQESVSTDAWLIGTVQEIVIPYTFTASFSVDLRQAGVSYDAAGNTIRVSLPAPGVNYYKLAVDEDSVQKYDLLYPLTTERYTQIKQEIEQKLFNEVINDPELKEGAWVSAVGETEALYQALLAANGGAATFDFLVIAAEPQPEE
ncbi:MAG: DUF4230 domain-containing protein [Bacillota bacterium]